MDLLYFSHFSTFAFFALALSLSMRLRKAELNLIQRIGGSKGVVFLMVFSEIVIIVLISSVFAFLMSSFGLLAIEKMVF